MTRRPASGVLLEDVSKPSWSALLDPPVTVVAQDPAQMVRTSAQALFGRIDGDQKRTARDQGPDDPDPARRR